MTSIIDTGTRPPAPGATGPQRGHEFPNDKPRTACLAERAARLGITPRELTVLTLLAQGLTAAATGRRLGISPRTVTKHQENLYRKLTADDRVTAVLRAQKAGLLPAEPAGMIGRAFPAT